MYKYKLFLKFLKQHHTSKSQKKSFVCNIKNYIFVCIFDLGSGATLGWCNQRHTHLEDESDSKKLHFAFLHFSLLYIYVKKN